MNTYRQLSLLPELEAPIRPKAPKGMKAQAAVVVELQCSTKRAASLMQIHTATLNRAKRQGKLPYRHGEWSADLAGSQGKKRRYWTVAFNR